ncbi:hypothetical protein EYR40_005854 [Pleurotus pulmonarius]|nr:hypothetical protein EYR36_005759 [Pleurotus pulmonarius]KAF4602639.1 hypothetical protein EYR40_005854 [Pleurotus pulmonarius]
MSHTEGLLDVAALPGLKIATYVSTASMAFNMYDYLLTLPTEVKYVWQANWGVGKVLYLLSRYPLLFAAPLELRRLTSHVISEVQCRVLYSLVAYVLALTLVFSETILIIRVWALWRRQTWVAIVFVCSAAAGAITGLVDILETTHSVAYLLNFSQPIVSLSYPICLAIGENRKLSIVSYVMIMVNAIAVFSLMAIVWIRSYRGVPFSSMMFTFYKDGLVYFAASLVTAIVNVIVISTQPREYTNLLFPTQAALNSVLSTRMLLNLRQTIRSDLRGVNSVLDSNARHGENGITGLSLRFAADTDGSTIVA